MMRHLVEVMLVLEGNQPWARALRDDRRIREQGGVVVVPLPSVSFRKMRRVTRRNSSDADDILLCGMMTALCEGVDKEIMRLIVSFI